jgi:hypothetical protein
MTSRFVWEEMKMRWSLIDDRMENYNSYPRLRVLLQKQMATHNRRSAHDLVQSRPLRSELASERVTVELFLKTVRQPHHEFRRKCIDENA